MAIASLAEVIEMEMQAGSTPAQVARLLQASRITPPPGRRKWTERVVREYRANPPSAR